MNTVLLVEDNADDVELVTHQFKKLDTCCEINVVSSGEEALNYFFDEDVQAETPVLQKPDLVLLDLGLPGMNGLDVLKKIKSNDNTKRIPVVVLSVSDDEQDIVRSYNYGVNSYLSKPLDFTKFSFTLEQLGIYWFDVNQPSPT